MTITQSLVSFVIVAGLLTITPGLDTAVVLRTVTSEGVKRGALAALGVVLGCLIWGGAVAIGLGALLAAAPLAFTVLKWAGLAYLVWLGMHLIRKPRTSFALIAAEGPSDRARAAFAWFWKGLLQNLLNPKIAIFYISFLPQFTPPGVPTAPYVFLLAAVHAGLGVLWFSALLLATRPLLRQLRRPGVVKAMDRMTGCVFFAFSAKLALARR